MEPIRAFQSGPLGPGRSQAVDAVLRKRCAEGGPAALRIGVGSEDGLAFGRYQLIPKAAWSNPSIQRRLSGGRLVPLGPGVVEISVAAPGLSDLTTEGLTIRADQLLNRAVRGLLRGLERLGLSVVYPGRDLITHGRRAVGHAAFDIDEAGRPLVQCQLALTTSLAEASFRLEEAGIEVGGRADLLRPEECITLEEALGEAPPLERLTEALLAGFARHAGAPVPLEPLPEDVVEQSMGPPEDSFSGQTWLAERTPLPEMDRLARVPSQLGNLQVALSLEEERRLGALRLAGEFIADWPAVAALESALRGCPADWREVARVVDRILDTPPHIVLGLGPRRTLPDAILRAAERPPSSQG